MTTTRHNTTTFANSYITASMALMDTIALTGAARVRQWFAAAESARNALAAAYTTEEADIAKQLIVTIYMTEVS